MERPLKISMRGGVVRMGWSTPFPRKDLRSRKSGAPTQDHVLTPRHQSSRTRRSVEDPGIGSPQLLVATDVLLHQSICEDM